MAYWLTVIPDKFHPCHDGSYKHRLAFLKKGWLEFQRHFVTGATRHLLGFKTSSGHTQRSNEETNKEAEIPLPFARQGWDSDSGP
jgi:hypothetical protein